MNITDVIIIASIACTMAGIMFVIVALSVMLGGHLVYRSSKPNAGPLFRRPDGEDGVGTIDDGLGVEEINMEADEDVLDQNARFKAIFNTNLEEK